MSPVQETQSMQEIRLLRGRLPRKGGGLTGMRTSNGNAIVSFLDHYYNIQIHTCINESSRISGMSPVCYILHSPLMGKIQIYFYHKYS